MPASAARKSAFSLIELLVVISIISVLISLLMPSLRQAREVAQGTLCASNLRQQGLAIIGYANDSRGYVCVQTPGDIYNYTRWAQLLSPYLGGPDTSHYTFASGAWYDGPRYAPNILKALQCPSTYRNSEFQEYPSGVGPSSYGINWNFIYPNFNDISWKEANPVNLNNRNIESRHNDLLLTADSVGASLILPSYKAWDPTGRCDLRRVIHGKKQNFGIADLHVETHNPETPRDFVLGLYIDANRPFFPADIQERWPVIWGKWNYIASF